VNNFESKVEKNRKKNVFMGSHKAFHIKNTSKTIENHPKTTHSIVKNTNKHPFHSKNTQFHSKKHPFHSKKHPKVPNFLLKTVKNGPKPHLRCARSPSNVTSASRITSSSFSFISIFLAFLCSFPAFFASS
jgi:hypothetical protein